jgi:hypothetical protein
LFGWFNFLTFSLRLAAYFIKKIKERRTARFKRTTLVIAQPGHSTHAENQSATAKNQSRTTMG